jgi:hypothetical protein
MATVPPDKPNRIMPQSPPVVRPPRPEKVVPCPPEVEPCPPDIDAIGIKRSKSDRSAEECWDNEGGHFQQERKAAL